MEVAEYTNIATNEAQHFYYVAVHDLILGLIKTQVKGTMPLTILDAGCGTGSLAKELEAFGSVEAIDMHDEAIKYATARGIRVTKASIEALPFEENTFSLVTSVDVIYHKAVSDDVGALKQIYKVLKPGGSLIIRVPAEPVLHSSHDEFVHTARRYVKSELRNKLLEAGFQVDRLTYCQLPLFIPAWIKARLDRGKNTNHNSVIEHQSRWLNESIKAVLLCENSYIIAGGNLHKGIGLVAVCKKPLRK
jgi:SAM-dependent methyltransferase